MLILTSWLKEFVPFNRSPDQLAADLTMAGLEAEGVENVWGDRSKVIAARIDRVEPHPSSERLHICTVDAGEAGPVKVVCGAPNCEPGLLTVLALPGAVIQGREISVSAISGVESAGMLCSMAEIGAGRAEEGIADLGGMDISPGDILADIQGFADYVLDLSITPNRSDCLSIAGVAREVAALYSLELKFPEQGSTVTDDKCPVPVRIDNPELCRRYAGAVIEGVRVGESPLWLKNRLLACGIRSLNNIVDITNYVMLELGQPMHAFDLASLSGPEIIVRNGEKGNMHTLDGREHSLEADMLAICDAGGPVAVAGVMGGFESQVTDNTTSIFLESACFTPSQVRKTAKKLKIPSESSYRFERGVDPELAPYALARAVDLVLELAGGSFKGGVDVNPVPYEPLHVSLAPERVNALLGTAISPEEMRGHLENVGVSVSSLDHGAWECVVPSWRPDIHEDIDLVEEIARMYGFGSIPVRIPVAGIAGKEEDSMVHWMYRTRDILSGLGMSEVISYSFLSEKEILSMNFAPDDKRMSMVRLQNPLTEEQAVMRTTLVASLLSAVARNLTRRNLDLRFFEIGTVFYANGSEQLPFEEQRLAGILTGRRHEESWGWPDEKVDFYDLKGLVESFCTLLGLNGSYQLRTCEKTVSWLVPGVSLELFFGDKESAGVVGLVSPDVCDSFGIEQEVFAFDFSMEKISSHAKEARSFTPLTRYPAMELDLAIIIRNAVKAEDVIAFVNENASGLMESCRIFDVYQGKPIPDGSKSLGLRFVYRSQERTLSEEDVAEDHENMVNRLLEKFKAVLRS